MTSDQIQPMAPPARLMAKMTRKLAATRPKSSGLVAATRRRMAAPTPNQQAAMTTTSREKTAK